MPQISTTELIQQIHAAPCQLVLAVTGGGSGAISQLLSVPGGSRTLLEAIVPYSAAALREFLDAEPEQFCSPQTARAMALAAFERGGRLKGVCNLASTPPLPLGEGRSEGVCGGDSPAPSPCPLPRGEGSETLPVGIGCTASLASDRPKRGAHRIHAAAQAADATITHSLELIKDRRNRADEEQIAAALVLNLIAEAAGIEARLTLPLLDGEQLESVRTFAPPGWRDLLLGQSAAVVSELHSSTKPRLVFPGAFNPLHLGHLRMATLAADRCGAQAEFEISIANVDKLGLDFTEMERRAAQFSQRHLPLWFTRAPTFVEKAKLFPGCVFIVGVDTIERIAHCKYYDHDAAKADAAFAEIADRDCRFLVFGRQTTDGFQTLAQLDLPAALKKLCDEVPATAFREDVSSTQLRQRTTND